MRPNAVEANRVRIPSGEIVFQHQHVNVLLDPQIVFQVIRENDRLMGSDQPFRIATAAVDVAEETERRWEY
jgi:hypothetical protein